VRKKGTSFFPKTARNESFEDTISYGFSPKQGGVTWGGENKVPY
jgi:hypothetical protein